MKKTIEMIKNEVSELKVTVRKVANAQREESYTKFKNDTLSELSKGFTLNTKESNVLASAYNVKKAFITSLKEDKRVELKENTSELVESVYSKVLSHAVKRVNAELKEVNTMVYDTYEPLKNNDIKVFNEYVIDLLGKEVTPAFFKFLRAYMFTTSEKGLSKNAYVNKFIELVTALKVHQKNFNSKFESVSFDKITKDIKVSTFNTINYTYEDLKALVTYAGYGNELVNDNMITDTKVLKKALKEVLILTKEEEDMYYELFK